MNSGPVPRHTDVHTLLDTRNAGDGPLRWSTVSEVSTGVDPGNAPLDEFEVHRKELTGYCYRMLGSGFEAEDAVQETMVRAWKNFDRFEGRSSVRSWLYRIATNVCLDMLQGPQRRARPMDLGPASAASTPLPAGIAEHNWVMPVPDGRVLPDDGDPADLAASRESIRLAFIAALQHLPAKQRAVLILREVLRWQATEVAELLETSVASVNSALQRARATLETVNVDAATPLQVDDEQRALLERYVDAFERYDITSLVSLLHEDATFTMPPFELWLQGTDDIAQWYVGQGSACEGSRLVATSANGCPAFASYKPGGDGVWVPFNLHLVEISGGRITGLHHFLYPELYPLFDLPMRLDA
ncbi:MAG: polymerase sigma-70 factor, subfamily [Acidimicrobiaceae bacterium]